MRISVKKILPNEEWLCFIEEIILRDGEKIKLFIDNKLVKTNQI